MNKIVKVLIVAAVCAVAFTLAGFPFGVKYGYDEHAGKYVAEATLFGAPIFSLEPFQPPPATMPEIARRELLMYVFPLNFVVGAILGYIIYGRKG